MLAALFAAVIAGKLSMYKGNDCPGLCSKQSEHTYLGTPQPGIAHIVLGAGSWLEGRRLWRFMCLQEWPYGTYHLGKGAHTFDG